MKKSSSYTYISFACFLICVLVWIPNVFLNMASPFWIITFVIAPIGVYFATFQKQYWLIAINFVMFFSFFILMFVGYYINSLTGGKP
ncbi:hypothetical protein LC087_16855 [Bacillus carboniphilus]|uniref:Uncharacterized protein n=1 Tax=Bacillus carboniphilus TaxID=86663 RepID=A0ABY9JSH4_9BACI|nr:hypothetical protein [Bacillus carboniphilus]WLR42355.1 hypothetical protein LC087_16855 [Bacillus carboniphilus]